MMTFYRTDDVQLYFIIQIRPFKEHVLSFVDQIWSSNGLEAWSISFQEAATLTVKEHDLTVSRAWQFQ